jgi:hypothetical protein
MLRDNLVELIEPMRNSAGTDLLALGIYQQKPASDDSLSCLENPRPEGAESSLTDNVTSPFPAEPRRREHYLAFLKYPESMRKSFSTTNVVEAINGQLEIMRRNSGGYFHSEETLKFKLGLAISSLEDGRWRILARTIASFFLSSMPCFKLFLRRPDDLSLKHNFIDKSPCRVTANTAPVCISTACSALCARCVRSSFIFVIRAS